MRTALVCGAGGFIGTHLVTRLKNEGYWVRGVDLKLPRYSNTNADEFIIGDLRKDSVCETIFDRQFNEVYQLACYDKKTEILTDYGWKLFKDLVGNEKIATLNQNTHQIEYHNPSSYISYKYNGKLYHFKGKSIDICVTPNHKMYVQRPHRQDWELLEARNCNKKQYGIKRTGIWKGSECLVFSISSNKKYRKETKKIFDFEMDLFLRFMGWYLSEGSLCKKKNGTYKIHVANTNEEYIEEIYDIIKEMGFNPHIDRSTSYGVSFCSQVLYDYLIQFGHAHDKFIPQEFKYLSFRQLSLLFDSLMKGDGNTDGRAYTTVSQKLADDVQEIAFKLGYSTTLSRKAPKNKNWREKFVVYLNKSDKSRLLGYPKKINYSGKVYCVDVPNHVIYIRRNGKTAWCGNCDMGGAGFVFTGENDSDIMHNSAKINLNIAELATKTGVGKLFYSSSACIYPEFNQLDPDNPECSEASAYPAQPDSEYGWEKLFSEHLYLAFAKNKGLDVRIARFHNIFGHLGSYNDGREKAPAAFCRKVAETPDGDVIEMWGDGKQTRSFLFIDECLEGVRRLMESDFTGPVNIGSEEMVSINELAEMIMRIAGKNLTIKHIPGPLGVRGRNSDNKLIYKKLGWSPNYPLERGLEITYDWIANQLKDA